MMEGQRERERCTDIGETCAKRILMASFTPHQPSVLPEHLSGSLGLMDGHIDTC